MNIDEERLKVIEERQQKKLANQRRKPRTRGTGYTRASQVVVKDLDGNVIREEDSLAPQEYAEVLAKDWQVILPGGARGAETIRADRKPQTWGMSPTRKEREAAHRRRIEEMREDD